MYHEVSKSQYEMESARKIRDSAGKNLILVGHANAALNQFDDIARQISDMQLSNNLRSLFFEVKGEISYEFELIAKIFKEESRRLSSAEDEEWSHHAQSAISHDDELEKQTSLVDGLIFNISMFGESGGKLSRLIDDMRRRGRHAIKNSLYLYDESLKLGYLYLQWNGGKGLRSSGDPTNNMISLFKHIKDLRVKKVIRFGVFDMIPDWDSRIFIEMENEADEVVNEILAGMKFER